jgi:hypothetical protein
MDCEVILTDEDLILLEKVKKNINTQCPIQCVLCGIIQRELNGADSLRFESPNTELKL